MEMVVHQAIGIQPKRITFFGLGQGVEELLEVGIVQEDAGAIIAPVERVVNQTVADQSRLSAHAGSLSANAAEGNRKMN
jgi:hypothetical protein